MYNRSNIILAIATTLAALMGGLFYAYSCSVNPGLAQLPDAQYLAAMQSINRAIQNPVFFLGFMGTLILLPISTFLYFSRPASLRFKLLLGSTLVYAIGVFGVTMLGNVPLNEALDVFDLKTASLEDIAAQRARFEIPWNQLNLVRTGASVLAVVLAILTCLSPRKE